MTGLPWRWGATPAEHAAAYACDRLLGGDVVVMTRAVDVAAPAAQAWRWLCQLRVAPYSYDWLDNGFRRSPRTLTPGVERLEAGQRFATVFAIATFEEGRSVAARMLPGWERAFGPCAFGYAVAPRGPAASRLIGRVVVPRRRGAVHTAAVTALAWGDLVMMRKQLRTLAGLAARDAQRSAAPSSV